MIAINIAPLVHIAGVLAAGLSLYVASLLLRFGSDTSRRSEAIAAACSLALAIIGYLVFFTNIFSFSWS